MLKNKEQKCHDPVNLSTKNAESCKEMERNPNIWIGMIVEDPEHWAEYGVYTSVP